MSYYYPHNQRALPVPPLCPVTIWATKTSRQTGFPENSPVLDHYYPYGPGYFPPYPPGAYPHPGPPARARQPPPTSFEEQLLVYRGKCNARTKKDTPCSAKASGFLVDGLLPVCRHHQHVKIRGAACEAVVDEPSLSCGLLIRLDLPYFPRCAMHLDDLPYPNSFMKLPSEIRCEIFSYIIPQGYLSSDQTDSVNEIANYMSLVKLCRIVSAEVTHVLFENVNFVFRLDSAGMFLCGSPLALAIGGYLHDAPLATSFPFHLLRKVTVDVLHRYQSTTGPSLFISSGQIELFELANQARKLSTYLSKATKLTDFSLRITVNKHLWRPYHGPPPPPPPPPPPYPPGVSPPVTIVLPTWLPTPDTPDDDNPYESALMHLTRNIAKPFENHLRGLSKVRLYQVMTEFKPSSGLPPAPPSVQAYNPPKPAMRPCPVNGEYHPNNSFIYHFPRPIGDETVLDVRNESFLALKTEWEETLKSTSPAPEKTDLDRVYEKFAVFHAEFHKVCLERTLYVFLVQASYTARLARSEGDEKKLGEVMEAVGERWDEHLKKEKDKLQPGKKAIEELASAMKNDDDDNFWATKRL